MDIKELHDELMKRETEYWQAIKDNDTDTAMRLTDDPCLVVGPTGLMRVNRKSFEEMMKSANYKLDDFAYKSDFQVISLDENIAIVAYKVREELTVDGEKLTVDATNSSTWIFRNGRWVCAHHTESLEGDPFGRDRKETEPREESSSERESEQMKAENDAASEPTQRAS